MCRLSGGQVYLVILSSLYVCSTSTVSDPNITRSIEDLSPGKSTTKKEAKHLLKGEGRIMREALKIKIQQTILQLESHLFHSQSESFIRPEDQKSKSKTKFDVQEQSNFQKEVRSKFGKRSPQCVLSCLRHRQLHPAQCHYHCTMSVG